MFLCRQKTQNAILNVANWLNTISQTRRNLATTTPDLQCIRVCPKRPCVVCWTTIVDDHWQRNINTTVDILVFNYIWKTKKKKKSTWEQQKGNLEIYNSFESLVRTNQWNLHLFDLVTGASQAKLLIIYISYEN